MKYEYTKTDITKAEDLVPGKHFIKIGETYCAVLGGYGYGRPSVEVPGLVPMFVGRFLRLGCPVYTRQAVEPLTFEGRASNDPSGLYIHITGCTHGPIKGKRFRCTEIMEDEG